jgi:hypothetical protein
MPSMMTSDQNRKGQEHQRCDQAASPPSVLSQNLTFDTVEAIAQRFVTVPGRDSASCFLGHK